MTATMQQVVHGVTQLIEVARGPHTFHGIISAEVQLSPYAVELRARVASARLRHEDHVDRFRCFLKLPYMKTTRTPY